MSNQSTRQQASKKIVDLIGSYVNSQYPGHKITTMLILLEVADETGKPKLIAMDKGSPIVQNILANSWIATHGDPNA